MLRVVETFASIQGESTRAGEVCFFIRLAGCNLACSYCDTRYANEAGAGRDVSVDALVEAARDARIPLVEVTGGEPLLQPETPELCRRLLAEGFTVLVETNGSLPIDRLPEGTRAIMDIKMPGSTMHGHFLEANLDLLRPGDEVKFVLSGRGDYEYALRMIREYRIESRTKGVTLLFGAVAGMLSPARLAEWLVADRVPARFQIQLHKLLWGDRRGV